jgi:uncharacterized membrane protein
MFFKKPQWIEKWSRSLSKVISWRVTVTLSNFAGAWLASGSLSAGLKFAGYAIVANSILYYLHERGWNRVSWQKEVVQDETSLNSMKPQ